MINKIKNTMTMAQIQSVLKSCGEIEFEPGIYNITSTLLLYSNSKINLNGAILRQASTVNHIFLTYSEDETTEYNGAYNIEIYNGTIEGMGKYKTKLNFITLCHSNNIYIHDIQFLDVVEFHCAEINSSRNVVIKDCKFKGFNSSLDSDDFRECIQIDWAVESALVVVPLGSAWYDGTPCENITIDNCSFNKSSSRPAPSQCIGNHCQVSGRKHNNIVIKNCKFVGGNQTNKNGSCINLIGMENVKILDNECIGFGRFVKICSASYSYGISGKLSILLADDGVCRNVNISGNDVKQPCGTCKYAGIYVYSKTGNHEGLYVYDNKFDAGINSYMTHAIYLDDVQGGVIKDNSLNGLGIKVMSTCNGILEI